MPKGWPALAALSLSLRASKAWPSCRSDGQVPARQTFMLHTNTDNMASNVERASAQCFFETAEKRMRGDPGRAGKDHESCSSVSVFENGTPSPCRPTGMICDGCSFSGWHIFLSQLYRAGVWRGVATGVVHEGELAK